MHGLHCAAVCAILLCPTALLASSVFRCEDASGHITYTLQGCPAEQTQQRQEAHNPTPGKGKAVPLAKPAKAKRRTARPDAREVTVVGSRDDGCGNRMTSSERRTAIIRQRIVSGMSRADVESSLGKPDRITQHNGQTRYLYRGNQGNNRQVSFDAAGCVKGKR
ncbi:DUF4124 domain-containing protein [Pseudomonas sp. EA_105y_Pfl2_R69]|uniref:DUF4124 domain-containing protein n=1 Tax=Pseudomonas sp. EA_105y_Pfl2_R69 TaxID=3088683 RepID=UPI0030DAF387